MSDRIYYRSGYRYQLAIPYSLDLASYGLQDYLAGRGGGNRWVELGENGVLHVAAGYAWDGSSGPARDTRKSMRGSLVHDALYQLMRLRVLRLDARPVTDRIYRDLCLEDGTWSPRAWWRYVALTLCGNGAASGPERPVLVAP